MADNRYRLPPMRALLSFESAARHVSFKAAARELNVTPAAISQQVKLLEQDLRFRLFDRHYRGVKLTETGAYLFVALQRNLEAIGDAVDQLRRRSNQATVTIQTTTSISSFWLTPRLGEFWQSHAHISVGQLLSDDERENLFPDLSIRYGDMTDETGESAVLFKDRIAALGSPAFVARHGTQDLSAIARMPLIHLDSENSKWTTWEDWAGELGYTGGLRTAHRVNNYVIALQAAMDGIGAVLGWEGLTHNHVRDGRLAQVFPNVVAARHDFYVTLHNPSSAPARLLFDWLVAARPHQSGNESPN